MDGYLKVLKNHAVFNGRARRKEFWIFLSYYLVGSILVAITDSLLGIYLIPPLVDHSAGIARPGLGLLTGLYMVAMIVPSLALSIRRLHDISRSGGWLLIVMIPVAGLILPFFFLQDSAPGSNRYGDNPKATAA